MSEQFNILVVEDETGIRKLLEEYLGENGYGVTSVGDTQAARDCLDNGDFHLVLLDLNLPGENGLSFARHLREKSTIGIIMLTARTDAIDRIVGMEMGADDYIPKPFEPREVLARVKALEWRLGQIQGGATPAPRKDKGDAVIGFDRFALDTEARRLEDVEDGQEVRLTTTEYNLLETFLRNRNKVLGRDQLLELAHNRPLEPYDRSIDVQITRLRKKIERNASHPELIKTVRGVGYIFTLAAEGEEGDVVEA